MVPYIKIFFSLIFIVVLESTAAFCSAPKPVSIFFLESASVDTPWTQAVRQGFIEELDQSKFSYTIYVDHLEAARFRERRQYKIMSQYLREKFLGREPDIVVTAGPAASGFLSAHPDLFPASKKFLISPGNSLDDNATVVDEVENTELVVREMTRLADPKKVFIVGDSV